MVQPKLPILKSCCCCCCYCYCCCCWWWWWWSCCCCCCRTKNSVCSAKAALQNFFTVFSFFLFLFSHVRARPEPDGRQQRLNFLKKKELDIFWRAFLARQWGIYSLHFFLFFVCKELKNFCPISSRTPSATSASLAQTQRVQSAK